MAAKVSNKHIYGTPEEIKRIKEESDYIGRNVSRIASDGHLIIFAVPPKRRTIKKKDEEATEKPQRAARRGNGYNRFREME